MEAEGSLLHHVHIYIYPLEIWENPETKQKKNPANNFFKYLLCIYLLQNIL